MECPTCKKTFKNLKQHVFKSHTKLYLTFERDEDGVYMLTAKLNDELIGNKTYAEAHGSGGIDDNNWQEFFIGEREKGWYIILHEDRRVEVNVSILSKKFQETNQKAFKNYQITFVKRKLKNKQ